jgi:hypothetical protein
MFKVIIAGGREFGDYHLLHLKCRQLLFENHDPSDIEIVSGKARGADRLGEQFAEQYKIQVAEFPADWSLGKQAGYVRNKQMAEYSDALIAFDTGGRGTGHMINLAREHGLAVRVVNCK